MAATAQFERDVFRNVFRPTFRDFNDDYSHRTGFPRRLQATKGAGREIGDNLARASSALGERQTISLNLWHRRIAVAATQPEVQRSNCQTSSAAQTMIANTTAAVNGLPPPPSLSGCSITHCAASPDQLLPAAAVPTVERARIGPIKTQPADEITRFQLSYRCSCNSQSTMVANGRRTKPQIFISPQSICNDPASTPPICGCFRGVWKLPAGCRSVVDAAVNSEPLHSRTRGINRRDCVRAIERRRLRHLGWPGFYPNGAVDSRTNGCASYVNQV
jgi:hypothetical protein